MALFKAKIAEQVERYDDMVEFMTEFVQSNQTLSLEERNLLSVAYKNKIGARRSSWRLLSSEEQRTTDEEKREIIKTYKEKIGAELDEIYKAVLDLIDNSLIPGIKSDEKTDEESKVFYYKMKGDYCRYKAEFSEGEKKEEASGKSLEAYKEANDEAKNLKSTNPIRLGLSLNFSVFYYEIMNDSNKACEIAKTAFDTAITDLDNLQDDSYKDSTLIMQLLRDNLTLWTSDTNDGQDGDAQE